MRLNFLPGKLVITEEPYVNPTAVSRSGDYLDIDVENWNLDTCPYAGYDFDTSALPAGFSMDDLDFVVTYNGEVTTNLDLDCTEASLENVAALKIDEEQGTVRLYPLWQGTYTITAQLKQGVTGYQFNAQTATVHVGTVPSVISIYVEEPDKIYHPGDELVVIVDETGEARRYDGTPFWLDAGSDGHLYRRRTVHQGKVYVIELSHALCPDIARRFPTGSVRDHHGPWLLYTMAWRRRDSTAMSR